MLARLKFDLNTLANEILDSLDPVFFQSKKTTFLDPAMGGGQFLKAIEERLRSYGHSDKNIAKRVTGYAENYLDIGYTKKAMGVIGHMEVKDINEIDDNMKFDVIVGNPPFSEVGAGNKTGTGKKSLLYPQFFKRATEISKTGAMIMPPTAQVNRDNKKHNDLIKLTAHNIVRVSEEEKNKMGVGIDMWTIYWGSEGDVNEHFIEEVVRNNVEWKIGTPRLLTDNISATKTKIHNTPAIKSIHQDGPVYIYTDMISKMPKAGWYVLFNREVSSTRGFNTSVIKLDGKTQLGSNVRFVEFKNKRDAVDFESKINSVDFIAACREAAGSIRKTITRATLQSISIT